MLFVGEKIRVMSMWLGMEIWLVLLNYGSSWKAHKYLCEFVCWHLLLDLNIKSLQITAKSTFHIHIFSPSMHILLPFGFFWQVSKKK